MSEWAMVAKSGEERGYLVDSEVVHNVDVFEGVRYLGRI